MTDDRAVRIAEFIKPLTVRPGCNVHLPRDFDPRHRSGPGPRAPRCRPRPYLAARGGSGKQSVNGSGPKKRKAKKTGRKAAA